MCRCLQKLNFVLKIASTSASGIGAHIVNPVLRSVVSRPGSSVLIVEVLGYIVSFYDVQEYI